MYKAHDLFSTLTYIFLLIATSTASGSNCENIYFVNAAPIGDAGSFYSVKYKAGKYRRKGYLPSGTLLRLEEKISIPEGTGRKRRIVPYMRFVSEYNQEGFVPANAVSSLKNYLNTEADPNGKKIDCSDVSRIIASEATEKGSTTKIYVDKNLTTPLNQTFTPHSPLLVVLLQKDDKGFEIGDEKHLKIYFKRIEKENFRVGFLNKEDESFSATSGTYRVSTRISRLSQLNGYSDKRTCSSIKEKLECMLETVKTLLNNVDNPERLVTDLDAKSCENELEGSLTATAELSVSIPKLPITLASNVGAKFDYTYKLPRGVTYDTSQYYDGAEKLVDVFRVRGCLKETTMALASVIRFTFKGFDSDFDFLDSDVFSEKYCFSTPQATNPAHRTAYWKYFFVVARSDKNNFAKYIELVRKIRETLELADEDIVIDPDKYDNAQQLVWLITEEIVGQQLVEKGSKGKKLRLSAATTCSI